MTAAVIAGMVAALVVCALVMCALILGSRDDDAHGRG